MSSSGSTRSKTRRKRCRSSPEPVELPELSESLVFVVLFLAPTQLTVEVQDRRRIVLDHLKLRDDFTDGLFLFDLLGDEPLQLRHGGKGLLRERELVERVDLPAH